MQSIKRISASIDAPLRFAVSALLIWIALGMGASTLASAQASTQEASQGTDGLAALAVPVVPQQVRFAGKLASRAGDTAEAVFRIYAAQQGGEPLWTETQRVTIGEDGSYMVLLGSASPTGLPQTVFAGGVARWLGISVEQSPELDRVMLASVPYAMKSADAEALAGHKASDFVTQEQLTQLSAQAALPASSVQPDTSGPVTGSGTVGTIPLWTGALTQGNSEIVQVGSDIGIHEATPGATLDVGGTATIRGATTIEGTTSLPAVAPATTTSGYGSQMLDFSASTWSSTALAPVNQTFRMFSYPTGNNTATPSGALFFQFQQGTGPVANILSIASNGVIAFNAAQTFPGTIKSVTGTSPVTAATTAGAVTVGLNTATLETTLNGIYPRLSAANSFTGNQSITGGLTVTGALAAGSSAVTGLASAAGGFLSNGAVTLKPATLATTTAAVNSPLFEQGASAYSSASSSAVAQNFAWQTQASGNNTTAPTANLALLFGTGTATPSATGLSIAPNGNINFSSSQVFPIKGTGGGTITGITTSSPLTGSGTAGSVALGLNTSALETTLNGVYPQLGTANTFAGYLAASNKAGPGNFALTGVGTNGSVGVFGESDTGYGVEGDSTSGIGVFSHVTNPVAGSAGMLGYSGTGFSAIYSNWAGEFDAGVWADHEGTGTGAPAALVATADAAYGAVVVTNGPGFPALFVENEGGTAGEFHSIGGDGVTASTLTGIGVYATSDASGYGVYGLIYSPSALDAGVAGVVTEASATGKVSIDGGVWGDTGATSTTGTWSGGVVGTADNGFGGIFLNNSSSWVTLYAHNYGSGGKGEDAPLFTTFMASSPDGTCGIGGAGNMSCTGQIKTLVSAGNNSRTVETYSVQSPENWMEDFGSGELKNGVAVVTIDPAFAETVTGDNSYHVFITPNADSRGLYVISKTATTFEVRESGGGTSSLTFDYRIVARRRGFEKQRLVDVTERFNAEQKANSPARSTGTRSRPAPLRKPPLLAALRSHPSPTLHPAAAVKPDERQGRSTQH